MFPEGHALAFAFTAYQMAWLRHYHPLEFFVALFNEQPMGFWDLDTLKQDARRLGLRVAHPDVNRSELLCVAEGDDTLRLGLTFVKGGYARLGETLLRAREAGPFPDLADLLARSGLPREALENLVRAGAMDGLGSCTDSHAALWQVGTGYVSGAPGTVGAARGGVRCPCGFARGRPGGADAGRVRRAGSVSRRPGDGTGAPVIGSRRADQRRAAGALPTATLYAWLGAWCAGNDPLPPRSF